MDSLTRITFQTKVNQLWRVKKKSKNYGIIDSWILWILLIRESHFTKYKKSIVKTEENDQISPKLEISENGKFLEKSAIVENGNPVLHHMNWMSLDLISSGQNQIHRTANRLHNLPTCICGPVSLSPKIPEFLAIFWSSP